MSREKKWIYPKLAVSGILKNGRTYVPYLLTCIGMVMMYYIMQYLEVSDQVRQMKGGRTLQEMLGLGIGVFSVFVMIFLFYSNTFLIKNRKREFGLYNILGMGKWNLARILVWESVLMAAISLVCGLGCGILFSKLSELCIAWVLESDAGLAFEFRRYPVVQTVKLFAVVFGVILLRALLEVGKSNPIDLLHSTSAGEKPPKGNWSFAFLGAVILAAAYTIAVKIENPMAAFLMFFIAVGMVVVATYLLFISGSVVLCRVLQKKKSYYYKPNHFISVSSMMYRMKRNGAGLASICILSTMVLVMLSAVTCLYVGKEDQLATRYPWQICMQGYTFDDTYLDQMRTAAQEAAGEMQVSVRQATEYRYLSLAGYQEDDGEILTNQEMMSNDTFSDYSRIKSIYLVSLEDYNRLTGKQETLDDGEALICAPAGAVDSDTISIENVGSWKLRPVEKFVENGDAIASVIDSVYLVLQNQEIREQSQKQQETDGAGFLKIWSYGLDVEDDDNAQRALAAAIRNRIEQLQGQDFDFPGTTVEARAEKRDDFYGLYSGLFVLGILLGMVFLVATVLIMYYKQVTEGYEDQARFDIMQKVGMTNREIRSSIRSQMFTVFLLPLVLAGVHTGFAFPIVQKLLLMFGVWNTQLQLATTLICFVVFGVFYALVYVWTSRAYYRIVA